MLADIIEDLAICLIAIGVANSFMAYFKVSVTLDQAMFTTVFGLLVFLIVQLETMDDRWK